MGVERVTELHEVPYSTLREILSPLIGHLPIRSQEYLGGGAMNTTIKAETTIGAYVLRFYQRSAHLCEFEAELLKKISQQIPSPKLLLSNPNLSPYPVNIFEWLPGFSIKKAPSSIAERIGTLLGKLHQIEIDGWGFINGSLQVTTEFPFGSSPYLSLIYKLIDSSSLLQKRLGEKRILSLRDFLEQNEEAFPIAQKKGVLVHSDTKPSNFVQDYEGNLSLIDWEFAHSGAPLFDLAILLRYEKQIELDLDAFVKSYERFGNKLPDEWQAKAKILDLCNLIELLSREGERPKLTQEILSIIDTTLALL